MRAPPSGVTCNTGAVNTAANYRQVINLFAHKKAHANAADATKAVNVASMTGNSAFVP